MAREIIQSRRNSYKRTSQRSSSVGPPVGGGYPVPVPASSAHERAPSFSDEYLPPQPAGGHARTPSYPENHSNSRNYPGNPNQYHGQPIPRQSPPQHDQNFYAADYEYPQQDRRQYPGPYRDQPSRLERGPGDARNYDRNGYPDYAYDDIDTPRMRHAGSGVSLAMLESNDSANQSEPPPSGAINRRKLQQQSLDYDRRVPVFLPEYEPPPRWIPPDYRNAHSDYEPNEPLFMPRRVILSGKKRDQHFGFHIRGGYDLNCGVYVSVVLRGSIAEKEGLKVKDLILHVNGVDFQSVSNQKAVDMLRSQDKLELLVRYFPAGYNVSLDYEKSPDTSREWRAG